MTYVSPAVDLTFNIFLSTDKPFRDKEYDNLLRIYYESLSKTVRLLGNNPDELFSFDNLQEELREYGNFVLAVAPIYIQTMLADSSQVNNFDKVGDELAKGEILDGLAKKNMNIDWRPGGCYSTWILSQS